MPKPRPCRWSDGQAEDAARLYTAVFPNSRILSTATCPEAAEEVSGKPRTDAVTPDDRGAASRLFL